MKFTPKDPPRRFAAGPNVEIADCGSMTLEVNEQITFVTQEGAEFDVSRKDWGFYATPSLNGRLSGFGLRAVLVLNRVSDRYFVWLVERDREPSFEAYLRQESCDVVAWLDTTEALAALRARLTEQGGP